MRIEDYAKKSFLALKNPYDTVACVHPEIIDKVSEACDIYGNAFYTGIKKTKMLPESLMTRLSGSGFLKHTVDEMAFGGRAVDTRRRNPLTGQFMTGSSSGTALNVFYGINDLGVGTDGGGSVLAPAAALNLYGFISPLIEADYMKQFARVSTDQITFSPSAGFIARDLEVLEKAIRSALTLTEAAAPIRQIRPERTLDIFGPREPLIAHVTEHVKKGTVLVSDEGPVDVNGIGDTIYGHFDEETGKRQRMSGKGLMRVVNMCGKTGMVIPQKGLARCTLLICESCPEDIQAMLLAAKDFDRGRSELIQRYFLNLNMYFE